MNPISGWNQGAFRVVGLNGKGDKLVVSLDGAILVSIKDSKLEFFYPDLSGVRNRFQPQPPQGKSEGGLRLNDQSVTVVQPDAQLKTHTYREDNVKELEKEDTKRAEVGSIEPLQISEEELLAKAMGGVRPVLLKEFVDDILTRAKKVESHLQQLEFSFKPIPLPDVLENETPPKS